MAYKETKGTHTNCACPHCGKTNSYVSDGVNVVCGKITGFTKPCHHCGQTIHYHASHEIIVTAHTEDPIERLRSKSESDFCFNCGYRGFRPLDGSCPQCGVGQRIG